MICILSTNSIWLSGNSNLFWKKNKFNKIFLAGFLKLYNLVSHSYHKSHKNWLFWPLKHSYRKLAAMTYLFHLILLVFFTFPLFSQKLPTEIPKSHQKMIQILKRIADQTAENNPYLGSIRVKQLQRELSDLPLAAPVRR